MLNISKMHDNNNINIKEHFIKMSEFKIINLPESGIEFLNKTAVNCMYCHKKNLESYLCLLCGNKMCNVTTCFIENKDTKVKEYSTIYHSKKCCGGVCLFLNIINGEIVYLLKGRYIMSNIFIYLNDYGEIFKDKFLTDEYKLNKEELDKGIRQFLDMTFRKNIQKTHFYYSN